MDKEKDSTRFEHASSPVAHVANDALKILELFSCTGISISQTSGLSTLVRDAVEVSSSYSASQPLSDIKTLIRGHYVGRVARAVLPLSSHMDRRKHLVPLKKGQLDPMLRARSRAKDKLWELELWALLNQRGIAATLEEPDIVAVTPRGKLGIACKRIYSPSNFPTVVSSGVQQILRSKCNGIVAVCLDDLLPESQIFECDFPWDLAEQLQNFMAGFVNGYHARLASYMASSRLAAVLVCTGTVAFVSSTNTIAEFMQFLVWTHPELEYSQRAHIDEFMGLLLGPD